MSRSRISAWSQAGLIFAIGGAITVVAAMAPRLIVDRQNENALRADHHAIEQALDEEMRASEAELTAVGRQWKGFDAVQPDDTEREFGRPPSTAPSRLFSGFTALSAPFLEEESDSERVLLVSEIERQGKSYVRQQLSIGIDLTKDTKTLGLDVPPKVNAQTRVIRLPLASLKQPSLFLPENGSNVAAPLSSTEAWGLAVPIAGKGWLVGEVRPDGVKQIVRSRARGRLLDVSLYLGTNSNAPLVAHARADLATWAPQRFTKTFEAGHQQFTLVAEADDRFATSWAPPLGLVALIGLSLTSVIALLFGTRQHRRNTRVLETELTEARQLARTDALTELPNRLALNEHLDHLAETGQLEQVALLMCDLDRFKVVNDARGHDVGDLLLQDVAQRLTSVLPSAMIARLGGDEFVIVVDSPSVGNVVDIGYQMVETLKRPFAVGSDTVVIGSSFGLAMGHGSDATRSSLLRDADLAMYAAKRSGGNQLAVVNDDLRERGSGQLDLELGLRRAFGTNQLVAWYQPIVDEHREIRALEALVRWNHPERGLMFPAAFLPAAKSAGLLAELSTSVLSQVCRDVPTWNAERIAAGFDPLIVHVNCVEEQLMDASFADVVASYLAAGGMDPSTLVLEVSEETALDRLPKGLPTIESLRAMGVRFSLDDFGFGNASLTMVRQLGGVAEIKLDKSIIDSLAPSESPGSADIAVIRAVAEFAKAQQVTLVAEGVEHEEQRTALLELGVDLFQGYLFSKPLPPGQIADMIRPDRVEGQLV
jgi:diguanylate cyclase (GGDEF)-like protein